MAERGDHDHRHEKRGVNRPGSASMMGGSGLQDHAHGRAKDIDFPADDPGIGFVDIDDL